MRFFPCLSGHTNLDVFGPFSEMFFLGKPKVPRIFRNFSSRILGPNFSPNFPGHFPEDVSCFDFVEEIPDQTLERFTKGSPSIFQCKIPLAEYSGDPPNLIIQGIWSLQSMNPELSPRRAFLNTVQRCKNSAFMQYPFHYTPFCVSLTVMHSCRAIAMTLMHRTMWQWGSRSRLFLHVQNLSNIEKGVASMTCIWNWIIVLRFRVETCLSFYLLQLCNKRILVRRLRVTKTSMNWGELNGGRC